MSRMKALNNRMGQGPYFSGKSLALVDLAFAPFLARFFIAKTELTWIHHFSRLEFWFKSLIEIDCISKIFDSNFNNNYLQSLRTPQTDQIRIQTTQTIRSPNS